MIGSFRRELQLQAKGKIFIAKFQQELLFFAI
jgi:hypothetical protein